jgi:hypothetical protein
MENIPVISALRGLRLEDPEFKDRLGYIMKLCPKQNNYRRKSLSQRMRNVRERESRALGPKFQLKNHRNDSS